MEFVIKTQFVDAGGEGARPHSLASCTLLRRLAPYSVGAQRCQKVGLLIYKQL